jgi:hypothetical protein
MIWKTRKYCEECWQVVSVPHETQTGHLPTTSLERGLWTILLGRPAGPGAVILGFESRRDP